jgi:hypothetical protein
MVSFGMDTTPQNLLFGESPRMPDAGAQNAERRAFDERGFALVQNVGDVNEACAAVERLLGNSDAARVPPHAAWRGSMQLAQVDLMPVCREIVPRTFEVLHFAMGQPLLPNGQQPIYPLLALFRPPDSPPSTAETRIVPLPRLLAQKTFGARPVVQERLINYVSQYGDGWMEPHAVNTFRLSCFARVLDAVTGRHELAGWIDSTNGEWLSGTGGDGETAEAAYYRKCGLDLRAAEERIRIGTGELLVIDNIRCVHGRIGLRAPREIYQLLHGVKSASPSRIEAGRDWMVAQLSDRS